MDHVIPEPPDLVRLRYCTSRASSHASTHQPTFGKPRLSPPLHSKQTTTPPSLHISRHGLYTTTTDKKIPPLPPYLPLLTFPLRPPKLLPKLPPANPPPRAPLRSLPPRAPHPPRTPGRRRIARATVRCTVRSLDIATRNGRRLSRRRDRRDGVLQRGGGGADRLREGSLGMWICEGEGGWRAPSCRSGRPRWMMAMWWWWWKRRRERGGRGMGDEEEEVVVEEEEEEERGAGAWT
ncbi:hypothetical protein BJ875DRAFT_154943 [Amylocarpus encephaloides]|uniref:Uncharacterized protein n=1 Tax=Amylocarpus encephaloides TaxID=45428 RepID=A0A9P7YB22_9HELO|nr:hypothetical protein BJ875DRAFT_154943 [Amylocarpus encephaloides]